MNEQNLDWISVGKVEDLPEGRVKSVTARTVSICLSHFDGQWAAMDNACPHQGGPLGEGSIEKGIDGKCWIRCPWHGWDFDPLTGAPPGGHEDTGQQIYPVEVRDGEVFVGLEPEPERARTVTDSMAETMVNWGVKRVFGMVGHSNLGLADAIRLRVADGDLAYVGVRHEGAAAFAASAYGKLHRPPCGLSDHCGSGCDKPHDRSLGRQGRPCTGAGADRSGADPGVRARRFPGHRSQVGVRSRLAFLAACAEHVQPPRTDVAGLQDGYRRAGRQPPDLPG